MSFVSAAIASTIPIVTISQMNPVQIREGDNNNNDDDTANTSQSLLKPAYFVIGGVFTIVLIVMLWLIIIPDARRPWSCKSRRHPHVQRQRGPGDAYEIEPEMWRGGGRLVGEASSHRQLGTNSRDFLAGSRQQAREGRDGSMPMVYLSGRQGMRRNNSSRWETEPLPQYEPCSYTSVRGNTLAEHGQQFGSGTRQLEVGLASMIPERISSRGARTVTGL